MSSHGLEGITSQTHYACSYLYVIARECDTGLFEAMSFLFMNPVDALASVNTSQILLFFILKGGLYRSICW